MRDDLRTTQKIPGTIALVGAFLMLLLALPAAAAADDARTQYFETENAYQKMLDTPSLRKYRHHWLRVIKGFQAVYDILDHGRSGLAWRVQESPCRTVPRGPAGGAAGSRLAALPGNPPAIVASP